MRTPSPHSLFPVLFLLVANATCIAAVPVYDSEPSGQFLKEWLLCGPFKVARENVTPIYSHLEGFETDFLEAIGGEENPAISEGTAVKSGEQSAVWKLHKATSEKIDLDEALSRQDGVVGYAYCEIESPSEKACLLLLGTNDGGRAWLNGEMIWDHAEGRGLFVDDDRVPVQLKPGTNRFLLKVEERGTSWGFCVRLENLNISDLVAKAALFDVGGGESGQRFLRFEQPLWFAQMALRDLRVDLFSTGDNREPVWTGAWTNEKEMPLDLDTDNYRRYVARVSGKTSEGEDLSIEIPFSAGKRSPHTLFAEGASDYSIVLSSECSDSERWAANELQHWIREAGGVELPLLTDPEEIPEKAIVLGYNSLSKTLLDAGIEAPTAANETFFVRNVGPRILIWGGADRGTMYGVMSFLEREMGVRFYTPTVTAVPKKEKFVFESLDHSESPGIRVRNDFYFEAFEPIWAARNRVNGAMGYRQQPGDVEAYWAVHTFFPLMPPEEFFSEHPEYYSLIDGKRVHERAQLCLTNPDVLRIITERVKQRMRESPEYLIYSVSQNDWHGACECEKCQAIVKEEGSESGPLIAFVNQVAEAVEKEFPNKYIGTLAYQYTRKPCKNLKPRENVVIRLCSIECCFSHDFKTCPENQEFLEDLRGWAEIAPHLYIWDYVVNFSHYIMPYPNFRVLQSNIQTFRENKAIGIMEQAAYQSRGGEFAELRAYLLARLLWNPDCDVEAVIDDFMFGYYGRSGQFVRQYFDLLHNRLTPETHIHLGLKPDDILFSDDFVRESLAIFEEAKKVADNEDIRRRVEMAELPILYLHCRRSPREAVTDGSYQLFKEVVEREGVLHYAESGQPHREEFHHSLENLK